jgi:hypothetical protein
VLVIEKVTGKGQSISFVVFVRKVEVFAIARKLTAHKFYFNSCPCKLNYPRALAVASGRPENCHVRVYQKQLLNSPSISFQLELAKL